MAARALTMTNSLPSSNRQRGFAGRLVLLLLFVAGITFWAYLVYQRQQVISKIMMTAFATLMIALAAGFGARFLFYTRNWFVRLITAWGSLILGLFLLGIITRWKMGIGPVEFWRTTYDWPEIAQLGGGMFIALLGLGAWRQRATPITPKRSSKPRRAPAREERRYEAPARSPRPEQPRLHTSESRKSPPKRHVHLKVAKQARAIERSAPRAERMVIGRLTKSVRPKRRGKLFHRKPELQISVHEEHRCPYCLEDVKHNDPRGVKECSICHTLHHADCWDITGMCQIPHLNS